MIEELEELLEQFRDTTAEISDGYAEVLSIAVDDAFSVLITYLKYH